MSNKKTDNSTKVKQSDTKVVNSFVPSMIYETSKEIVNSIDSKETRKELAKKYSNYFNFK